MSAIEGTKGWFSKCILALKGNCRWCDGSGKMFTTIGPWVADKWGEKATMREMNQTYTCPRCGGTGDEPLLGRKPI